MMAETCSSTVFFTVYAVLTDYLLVLLTESATGMNLLKIKRAYAEHFLVKFAYLIKDILLMLKCTN